ncbi:endo alpha-1,4 polygalactosaminidase [Chitinophaga pendula]|uniref:endo alpha-1,4 polygalactosaminidase n=1 Tax=Chitinophaga TaxID=79328 RepID=UPI000BB02A2C|nr:MULTISPECIES: endo alpha-1,4 polygalactosaminidase [Chitinophaga]ASZ12571.1 endo alpha-1,4 polygalactosaminidase [Chitinophaga sp. MD30]UCJ09826.1 endo alpha-1,4 polygalactosaminidase [Chitinophaga pendula]
MIVRKKMILVCSLAVLAASCSKGQDNEEIINPTDSTTLPGGKTTWWKPTAGISFDWVLDDVNSNNTFSGTVVDVDAFTTSPATVASLHAKGHKVIAYLSVGTLENDRNDASLLPAEVIGKRYDQWPKERWLDIRQIDKLKPWLNSRFNMIIQKGFDGIEPDNLDGFATVTGFSLTESDARKYMDYLITTAHANGLSIGQKNVADLSADYSSKFDWALTEDAFQQGWQERMTPYARLNKPVFAVEYTDNTSQQKFETTFCPQAAKLGFTAILKHRNLDTWVDKCK